MYFNKLLGTIERLKGVEKIIRRTATRAIIVRNGKILLVHSKKGFYELPGGGVEERESYVDALVREVAEETGYINCKVKNKIGVVTEKRKDCFEKNLYFQMDSHYYLCELLDEEKSSDQPDNYEWEPGTSAVWIEPAQARLENQAALKGNAGFLFIHRENFVLGEVERIFGLVEEQEGITF
ncbi:ADP-ribose pyrophosphatase YjhB (NUDIX family) [Planomicrobium soli]|uniref:ADP-ribose pyrophosphatase YjhB (NUDIX family) n=1 Tax=Planomicrobium soli TaxID=1176648 RepID=A0A2P8H5L7_9BACL|nr:NUDIX domain-containing protein [Planomicrobium soli]PSL41522.1 ADP-ribose pyrophosphatase YjhB (NUDIX family) [Planomicrobium soli]